MAAKKVPELDLHGYSVTEAITRFVEWYDEHHVAADGAPRGRLKVIHGWGSTGVGGGIGEALSKLLDQSLDRLAYFSPHDNTGVTIIQPHARSRSVGTNPARWAQSYERPPNCSNSAEADDRRGESVLRFANLALTSNRAFEADALTRACS